MRTQRQWQASTECKVRGLHCLQAHAEAVARFRRILPDGKISMALDSVRFALDTKRCKCGVGQSFICCDKAASLCI